MKEQVKQGIKNSNVFIVLGTESYFGDVPMDEVNLAKELKKPFRVLVDVGVKVPDSFGEGVEDYKEKVFNLHQIKDLDADEMKEFSK